MCRVIYTWITYFDESPEKSPGIKKWIITVETKTTRTHAFSPKKAYDNWSQVVEVERNSPLLQVCKLVFHGRKPEESLVRTTTQRGAQLGFIWIFEWDTKRRVHSKASTCLLLTADQHPSSVWQLPNWLSGSNYNYFCGYYTFTQLQRLLTWNLTSIFRFQVSRVKVSACTKTWSGVVVACIRPPAAISKIRLFEVLTQFVSWFILFLCGGTRTPRSFPCRPQVDPTLYCFLRFRGSDMTQLWKCSKL